MRSTTEQLLREIHHGEDSFIELKEVVLAGERVKGPKADALADELAAFANSRGGVLILGVHDRTREILGIPWERLDAVVTYVRDAALDRVKPPLDFTLERMEVPDSLGQMHCVVRVSVDPSIFVHQSPGGYLRRAADAKRQISSDALLRLAEHRRNAGATRFDEQVVASASFSDLNPNSVRRFRTVKTGDDDETLAVKLGMAQRQAHGEVVPTVSGILIGARKTPPRQMPNAIIRAVAYRGRFVGNVDEGINYQLDACDIHGPLDAQVAEACRFVTRNQRVAAEKTIGRRDTPQYDLSAVFEGIVNAVAHRDYSIYGSAIRLRMFADRLELDSPGALPNTLTVDMLEYRQVSRNTTISNLLARCPIPEGITGLTTDRTTLMDRRGEGVGLILRKSEEHSGRKPKYELLDDSELRLTIYAASHASEQT